jgi:hypothetical protein
MYKYSDKHNTTQLVRICAAARIHFVHAGTCSYMAYKAAELSSAKQNPGIILPPKSRRAVAYGRHKRVGETYYYNDV